MRDAMVTEQIAARGVRDLRILQAMRRVPRHVFVPGTGSSVEPDRPEELAQIARAYQDRPLSIGHGQTISQPYIVAAMTECAALGPNARVLEIGTGSGYQTAILAELAAEVYTLEIVEPLGRAVGARLSELGYRHIHTRLGDGYQGWPEAAPFDAIVVTAAPPSVPEPLVEQLADGGRLVIPVGNVFQDLRVITRRDDHVSEEHVCRVRFVPMTGEAQR